MLKKILFPIFIFFISVTITAQISFTNVTSSLNDNTLKSGVAMAIVDMNKDGLDDIVRLSNASDLRIEFQQTDGSFVKLPIGNVGSAWAITIADVDENGYNDIIAGGSYNGLDLALANSDGTAYTLSTLSGPSIFLQNSNFADIDNDGAIDYFGCHDDGISSPYKNDGSGGLTYDLGLINAESTVPSDNSGNYGSIWVDYDNDGDLDMYLSKCRLGVSDTGDGRRRNQLFQNDGSNNFTDVAGAAGLLPLGQTWATNFEDIDNDGDFDVVMINHDITCQIYINNGNGTFTDITASSGIATELSSSGIGLGIQLMMEDFNNDTFIDIFLTGRSGVHYLFLNDGDSTFTTVASPFPGSVPGIQSGALGDINNDGFIDILAGHALGFNTPSGNADHLFQNNGNLNNWTKIILEGTTSNSNGVAAKVEAYGVWGKQIREVRAGESYGTQNSFTSHFGLDDATSINRIVVKWPSGNVDLLTNPNINETLSVVEAENGTCTDITIWDGTWSKGSPTSSMHAIISANYNTSVGDIDACTLTILAGATLTIRSNEYVNVENVIKVDGTLDVLHQGSLVQVNDIKSTVTNNGNIIVRKTTPNLESTSFMILGSPMTSETREGVFGNGNRVLNHVTGNFVPNPAVAMGTENFADDNNNNWEVHSGVLNPSEGYLVKPQSDVQPFGIYDLDYTLGTLNSGAIAMNLLYNGTRQASLNILSNPYASAINVDFFLAANLEIDAVYYWEHITPPSGDFPGFNQLNYNLGDISVYNQGSGGVAAPNGGTIPTPFMASGQGFAVKALGPGNAFFSNGMRVTGPNTDYRTNEASTRQRIWLDLKNNTYNLSSNMLIAFTENATDGFESMFDSMRIDTPVSLYSLLEDQTELSIQGRSTFNLDQEVALGFSTQVEELQNYVISIRDIEGQDLQNTNVYLEDRLMNIRTNLSEENYIFNSNVGNQKNRFVLVFKERVLTIGSFALENIILSPNPTSGRLNITSPNAIIESVEVIDLQGRLVLTKEFTAKSSSNEVDLNKLVEAMYFVKIYSSEGILTKRVIRK